jgi:hypothetical protein
VTGRARLAVRLLRLYPRRWRERYESEVGAVLEEHQVRLATLADLVAGAVAARRDPVYRSEEGLMTAPSREDRRRYIRCSFCGKGPDQVRKLVAGPGVYICDKCIELCNEVLADRDRPSCDAGPGPTAPGPPPDEGPRRGWRVTPRNWLRNLFRSAVAQTA